MGEQGRNGEARMEIQTESKFEADDVFFVFFFGQGPGVTDDEPHSPLRVASGWQLAGLQKKQKMRGKMAGVLLVGNVVVGWRPGQPEIEVY
jgi:hypothetical protein